MNNINLINFIFNIENSTFSLSVNIWFLLALFILLGIYIILIKKSKLTKHRDIEMVEFEINFGFGKSKYSIKRNYQNIQIAHQIYIELITRKIAIEINKDNDVIVEVYKSWYSLFDTTRKQLKLLKGKQLSNNEDSKKLIELLTNVLNEGLRPHLTLYQAKFKKWYQEELENKKNIGKSPQEIQMKYKEFDELIFSMKEVNGIMKNYSNKLLLIINGA